MNVLYYIIEIFVFIYFFFLSLLQWDFFYYIFQHSSFYFSEILSNYISGVSSDNFLYPFSITISCPPHLRNPLIHSISSSALVQHREASSCSRLVSTASPRRSLCHSFSLFRIFLQKTPCVLFNCLACMVPNSF